MESNTIALKSSEFVYVSYIQFVCVYNTLRSRNHVYLFIQVHIHKDMVFKCDFALLQHLFYQGTECSVY
jgi:hypothetical protein